MTFVLSVLRLKYRNQIKFTNALSKCVSNDRPAWKYMLTVINKNIKLMRWILYFKVYNKNTTMASTDIVPSKHLPVQSQ